MEIKKKKNKEDSMTLQKEHDNTSVLDCEDWESDRVSGKEFQRLEDYSQTWVKKLYKLRNLRMTWRNRNIKEILNRNIRNE